MKRTDYKTYLGRACMTVAFMSAVAACVEEEFITDGNKSATGEELSIMPKVSDGTVVTRAESVVDLKEKDLVTLDVFVEHVTNGTGDGTFMKQYHLNSTQATITEDLNLLANNWRREGLLVGEKYNIYVATNNKLTKDTKDLSTFNVAALKALTYDEVSDEVAVVNADNDITWKGDFTSGNIYKMYSATPGSWRALTNDKQFMMDGIIKNWTPDATTRDQVFEPLTLSRAAAKIVLNVHFDEDFLKSLTQEKKTVDGVEQWVNKPVDEQVTITGSPAWKFYNFAFGAPVFAPETQGDGIEVHNSGFNIFHDHDFEGTDKHFQIITYTYPNKWAAADYTTKAPSLTISIPFRKYGQTTDDYHYYRIPLVKSDVTAIERNHIYVVNATIASRGSESHDDEDEIEDVQYKVLPWNDGENSNTVKSEVESVQHYYLKVNPTVYTLRGDGDQSVILNYTKASGTKVNWKLFTYDDDGNQTGVVANNDPNAERAWYYNSNGDFTTTYNDNEAGVDWSNTGNTPMGVRIVQSEEGVTGSKGTVTVTSHALNNRAIKYIRLRVYLDEEATFQDGKETMYEDIIIRHFPTDNIQSIDGSWSSYHTTDNSTQTVTLTTRTLSEAQSWAEQYGVELTTSQETATDYITPSEYLAHSSETGYARVGYETRTRQQFRNALTTDNDRRAANGEENAVLAGDGYYYWGVNPSTSTYNNRWYTYNGTYYAYANGYRAQYTHTYSYTQYSVTVQMASTGNWVDWERDANQTYSGNNRKINGNGRFYAKAYDNGIIKAIVVNNQGSDKTYSLKWGNNYDYYYYWNGNQTSYSNTYFNATNNHMYVIQISSTSDEYVLGRPIKGNPSENQSLDDVASPAFMIASQLGAVTQFTGNNAATDAANHCDQYMEVAEDGTRYTGWRLPTQSEIGVISRYQSGKINGVTVPTDYQTMSVVLGGDLYWCLSGQKIQTSNSQPTTEGNAYLRCVRDLSAAEVNRLNGFDKIQEKYK